MGIFRFIAVCILFWFAIQQPVMAQQKRALLIGVGNYPKESGWDTLSSRNDIQYLRSVLPLTGFKEDNISILLNEQATYSGIEAAVEKLINACKPGDIVMLHFSGHGQQITDDGDDEPDGYDEAWIPYDAYARFDPTGNTISPAYRGEKHLRDDIVGKWVTRLSENVGTKGSVFVSIDACHSGTATRSQKMGMVRGNPTPFKIPGKKKTVTQNTFKSNSEFLDKDAVEKSNVVVFSASSPTQENYETKDDRNNGVGSLTYAFAKAMVELPGDASYDDLFYRVKAKIQAWIPDQLPMMQGDGKQLLFAGDYTAGNQTVYIDRWASDTSFTIKMGTLQQLHEGAELSITDPQTNRQVATAVITNAGLAESMATIRTPLDKTKPWGVQIKSLPAMPNKLLVGYDLAAMPKNWVPILDAAIKSFGFTEKNNKTPADCWITYLKDTGLAIITKEADIYYLDGTAKTGKLTKEVADNMKLSLQGLARSNYMRKLPDGGSLAKQVIWQVIAKDGRIAGEHELEFSAGNSFNILLKNNSSKPVYYSIINILPDGKINILLPLPEETAEDRSLQPKESFPIPNNTIEADAKTGREFLRVMVSHSPFDLRPAFNPKAKPKRGSLLSWEQAMIDIMQTEANTMPKKRSVEVNEITILTQSFMVKQP